MFSNLAIFVSLPGQPRAFYYQPDSDDSLQKPSVALLKDLIHSKYGIPHEIQRIFSCGGRFLPDVHVFSSSLHFLSLSLGLSGGKGGFGSLLRSTVQLSKNSLYTGDSRALDGRKIKEIEKEKLLESLKEKAGEEKRTGRRTEETKIPQEEKKSCKWGLNCRHFLKGRCKFDHPPGLSVENPSTASEAFAASGRISLRGNEEIKQTLLKGLENKKRIRQDSDDEDDEDDEEDEEDEKISSEPLSSNVFLEGLEDFLEDSAGGENSSNAGKSKRVKKIKSSKKPANHSLENNEEKGNSQEISSSSENSKNPGNPIDSTITTQQSSSSSSSSSSSFPSSLTFPAVPESSPAPLESAVSAAPPAFPPIDLSAHSTLDSLLVYSPDHLKSELFRRGLKFGGTREERAKRLFLLIQFKGEEEKIPKAAWKDKKITLSG